MWQSNLALEKYWVIQSGYFRLANTVALGMGITYGKLLYCHGFSEENVDRKFSTLDYNNRTVYDYFNNPFIDEFGIPALNLPPNNFYDIPCPNKIFLSTPDLLLSTISVASKNYLGTFNIPSD